MKKSQQRIVRKIKYEINRTGLNISMKVVERRHLLIDLFYQGKRARICVSSTNSKSEHYVNGDIRSAFRQLGVYCQSSIRMIGIVA